MGDPLFVTLLSAVVSKLSTISVRLLAALPLLPLMPPFPDTPGNVIDVDNVVVNGEVDEILVPGVEEGEEPRWRGGGIIIAMHGAVEGPGWATSMGGGPATVPPSPGRYKT